MLLLDDGLESREHLDEPAALAPEAGDSGPWGEGLGDAGFPVDQCAVAVEAQGLEILHFSSLKEGEGSAAKREELKGSVLILPLT